MNDTAIYFQIKVSKRQGTVEQQHPNLKSCIVIKVLKKSEFMLRCMHLPLNLLIWEKGATSTQINSGNKKIVSHFYLGKIWCFGVYILSKISKKYIKMLKIWNILWKIREKKYCINIL